MLTFNFLLPQNFLFFGFQNLLFLFIIGVNDTRRPFKGFLVCLMQARVDLPKKGVIAE